MQMVVKFQRVVKFNPIAKCNRKQRVNNSDPPTQGKFLAAVLDTGDFVVASPGKQTDDTIGGRAVHQDDQGRRF